MVAPSQQLSLGFVKARKKRGGLDVDVYAPLMDALRAAATRVATQFNLPPFSLDADRPTSTSRYGICHADGTIRVRLVHATTGRPLKYSALIDTVVHELAHLRYLDHGPRWEAAYQQMLEWCRQDGIYEPRPVPPPSSTRAGVPAQLGIFDVRP